MNPWRKEVIWVKDNVLLLLGILFRLGVPIARVVHYTWQYGGAWRARGAEVFPTVFPHSLSYRPVRLRILTSVLALLAALILGIPTANTQTPPATSTQQRTDKEKQTQDRKRLPLGDTTTVTAETVTSRIVKVQSFVYVLRNSLTECRKRSVRPAWVSFSCSLPLVM